MYIEKIDYTQTVSLRKRFLNDLNKVLTFFSKYDIRIANVYVIDYLVTLHVKFMKGGYCRKNIDGLKYIHF